MTIETLTVKSWLEHWCRTGQSLHVFVNGEDVTSRCFFAQIRELPLPHVQDGLGGFAECFKLNERGEKYINRETSSPATETLRGLVRIEPGVPILREGGR